METCKYGLGASTRKPPTARWVWRWVLSPRQYLLNSAPSPQLKELKERIEALEDITEENEEKFDEIYLALAQLAQKNKQNNQPRNPIGFVKPQ